MTRLPLVRKIILFNIMAYPTRVFLIKKIEYTACPMHFLQQTKKKMMGETRN